jgi:predicted  nucleic acid-binding Zn-ribbon protein
MNPKLLLLLALLLGASLAARADDQQQESTENKMRQLLKDTIGQLRDAQNQVVTLQATQAQSDADKAKLQSQLDAITAQLKTVGDQAVADKADAQKQISDLKAQVTDQQGQIERLTSGLKEWKDAYQQSAQLAQVSEAARKQYAIKAAVLQQTVDDREAKNLALYKLANEILTRYEKFGLGEALEAKEPFTGLSRAKLETLVQDYKNKILDQAATTGQTSAAPAPAQSLEPVPAPGAKPATPASAGGENHAKVANSPATGTP